ncbi:MAG TPA: diacylglycerol kinase [Burkholderiales bacterium]|nr:diacylglycerol kinase [Burkholderiales bacterium]
MRRAWNATRYSFGGLAAAARHEAAFRELVLLFMIAVPAAFWLGETGLERAVMIAVVALALVVELINAAIEAVVDRISLENHALAKRAKDIGSAAVMVSLANAAAVWLMILLSR